MSTQFDIGDSVKWKWGDGYGEGKVVERFTERVSRTLDGTEVARNASDDEPAYLIKQDDGAEVLKSQTEIENAA